MEIVLQRGGLTARVDFSEFPMVAFWNMPGVRDPISASSPGRPAPPWTMRAAILQTSPTASSSNRERASACVTPSHFWADISRLRCRGGGFFLGFSCNGGSRLIYFFYPIPPSAGEWRKFMKDAKTLAYINLFAVLGAIPYLCDLDREAAELIKNKSVSVGFAVKDGPEATLFFGSGKCRMAPGVDRCQVKLPFSSCEKFNGLIDGTVTPIPSKGFTKIGFLTGPFTKLTDRLTMFLKPDPAALEDPEFFRVSTTLMFHVIAEAIAQIANHDRVGMFSASNIVDGTAKLSIAGGPAAALCCRDHRVTAVHQAPAEYLSYMEFQDMALARALFDGNVNAISAVGLGQVRIGGQISQVDNINRILDRVAVYLA